MQIKLNAALEDYAAAMAKAQSFLAARRVKHGDLRMEATETDAAGDQSTETEASAQESPETDWKAEARKWERLAKDNKTAARKLAEIEEATKTEAQKTAERLAVAEKAAVEAERRALRAEVAIAKGLTPSQAKRLIGESREELEADADELLKDIGTQKKQGNHVPREGATNPTPQEDEMRAYARTLFERAQS